MIVCDSLISWGILYHISGALCIKLDTTMREECCGMCGSSVDITLKKSQSIFWRAMQLSCSGKQNHLMIIFIFLQLSLFLQLSS